MHNSFFLHPFIYYDKLINEKKITDYFSINIFDKRVEITLKSHHVCTYNYGSTNHINETLDVHGTKIFLHYSKGKVLECYIKTSKGKKTHHIFYNFQKNYKDKTLFLKTENQLALKIQFELEL